MKSFSKKTSSIGIIIIALTSWGFSPVLASSSQSYDRDTYGMVACFGTVTDDEGETVDMVAISSAFKYPDKMVNNPDDYKNEYIEHQFRQTIKDKWPKFTNPEFCRSAGYTSRSEAKKAVKENRKEAKEIKYNKYFRGWSPDWDVIFKKP